MDMRMMFLWFLLLLVHSVLSMDCPFYCACQNTTTNCSNQGLDTFPPISPDTQILNLSGNNLTSVNLSQSLPSLTFLNLSNSSVKTAIFPSIQLNLKYIDLSSNKLSNLSTFNLSMIPKLKRLDLSKNPNLLNLNGLRSASLKYLYLMECSISRFQTNILSNLSDLELLNLSNNPIRNINKLESNTLKYLDMSYGRSMYIELWQLEKFPLLKSLNVSFNKDLHVNLEGSDYGVSIENLDFSHSALQRVDMKSFYALQNLNISGNLIEVIDQDTFRDNGNLSKLILSHNKLSFIHNLAFEYNTKLLSLNLRNNKLKNGDWTMYLIKLTDLDVSKNEITSFDNFQLRSLTHLYGSENRISSRYLDFSSTLPNIGFIDLSENTIEAIDEIISHTLHTLILRNCAIMEVNEKAFKNLKMLAVLDLTGNKLNTLDFKMLSSLPKLTAIGINHNPWNCDCKSDYFRRLYEFLLINHTLAKIEEARCPLKYNWTWDEACKSEWTSSLRNPNNNETFLILAVFFLAAFCICGVILYCRYRRENQRDHVEQRTEETALSDRLSNDTVERDTSGMRRAFSTTAVPTTRSITPPPNYEEAILLPQISEVQRMTRSADFFLDRRMTGVPNDTPQLNII